MKDLIVVNTTNMMLLQYQGTKDSLSTTWYQVLVCSAMIIMDVLARSRAVVGDEWIFLASQEKHPHHHNHQPSW